jgi:hypothetical protein
MKNFYNSFSVILLFLSFSLTTFSQTVWDTLPWKSYADYKLQQLNKSNVTSGVLYDRVFPIAHMDEHTGLSLDEDTTSSDHSNKAIMKCTIPFITQRVSPLLMI